VLQAEVEALEVEGEADHVRLEDAQRLFEQLLTRLVTFEHGHGAPGHRPVLLWGL
jgi:hypothetical protein